MRGWWWLGGSALVLGCTAINPLYAESTGGETTSTTSSTSPVSGRPTSTDSGKPITSAESGDSGSTSHPGPTDTEIDPDTTGQPSSTTDPDPTTCSTYVQDCPNADEKCMPWASDGGMAWNALGCFPLDPRPGAPGDVCTVDGSAVSGVDDCDETSMCWDVDIDSNQGTCVAFCTGTEGSPVCDDPGTRCVQNGVIAVCLNHCDPLLQDCPDGATCVPNNDGFVCVPDASDMPQPGAQCDFVNQCGPGSVCLAADVLVGCEAVNCCTTFCDLSVGNLCPQEAVCVPWFAKGTAPPGLENVGVCGSAA